MFPNEIPWDRLRALISNVRNGSITKLEAAKEVLWIAGTVLQLVTGSGGLMAASASTAAGEPLKEEDCHFYGCDDCLNALEAFLPPEDRKVHQGLGLAAALKLAFALLQLLPLLGDPATIAKEVGVDMQLAD